MILWISYEEDCDASTDKEYKEKIYPEYYKLRKERKKGRQLLHSLL